MTRFNYKTVSNLLFAVAFILAALLLTNKTFGFRKEMHIVFFATGGAALLLALISSRKEAYRNDFNVLGWIGNLIIFIALLLKYGYSPYWYYALIAGMLLTALSYFVDPFGNGKDTEQEDDLLDR